MRGLGLLAAKAGAPTDARSSIFRVPVGSASLVYAPLHGLAAVLSDGATRRLAAALYGEDHIQPGPLRSIADHLRDTAPAEPPIRTGPVTDPLFLGVIPTRGCNMVCGYCDFAAPGPARPTMSMQLARAAVDGYLALLDRAGHRRGSVHFFGGEPFHAARVVEFVVEYAGARARESGITLHFEVSTNGLFGAVRAEWVADMFSTVVLSLDGLAPVQDAQRPARHHRRTFGVVSRTARILSEGSAELIVRSCVTSASLDALPEWAGWIAGELRPSTVCLESLTGSASSAAAGLRPPDPFRYARQFTAAAQILDRHGIRTVQSTTDLSGCRVSACPVGRDALIVSPEGGLVACYLLDDEWRGRGLDLRMGRVDTAGRRLDIDAAAVRRVRRLAGRGKPLCAGCFCRYHCAGGCHVHHDTGRAAGGYDGMCVATRLITADKVLRRLGLPAVADECLAEPAATALARNLDDRLTPATVP